MIASASPSALLPLSGRLRNVQRSKIDMAGEEHDGFVIGARRGRCRGVAVVVVIIEMGSGGIGIFDKTVRSRLSAARTKRSCFQRALVVLRVKKIGWLLVPLASNWPLTCNVAPVFINSRVPGSMVTITLERTTTVPCSRFVPDQVASFVTGPEIRFVMLDTLPAESKPPSRHTDQNLRGEYIKQTDSSLPTATQVAQGMRAPHERILTPPPMTSPSERGVYAASSLESSQVIVSPMSVGRRSGLKAARRWWCRDAPATHGHLQLLERDCA